MYSHLHLTKMRLGLAINFDAKFIRDGIARVVNGLPEDQQGRHHVFSLRLRGFAPLRLKPNASLLLIAPAPFPSNLSYPFLGVGIRK
jgi:hypothetical protein